MVEESQINVDSRSPTQSTNDHISQCCSSKENTPKQVGIEELNVPMEDNDAEVEETTPITIEPVIDDVQSTPSFHYGMAVAQDVFELDENLKIDAKMEIMQVIAKYQKKQLHRTVMSLAGN